MSSNQLQPVAFTNGHSLIQYRAYHKALLEYRQKEEKLRLTHAEHRMLSKQLFQDELWYEKNCRGVKWYQEVFHGEELNGLWAFLSFQGLRKLNGHSGSATREVTTRSSGFPPFPELPSNRIISSDIIVTENSRFGTIRYKEVTAVKTFFVKSAGPREREVLRVLAGVPYCINAVGQMTISDRSRASMTIGSEWVVFPYVGNARTLASWKRSLGNRIMSSTGL